VHGQGVARCDRARRAGARALRAGVARRPARPPALRGAVARRLVGGAGVHGAAGFASVTIQVARRAGTQRTLNAAAAATAAPAQRASQGASTAATTSRA